MVPAMRRISVHISCGVNPPLNYTQLLFHLQYLDLDVQPHRNDSLLLFI